MQRQSPEICLADLSNTQLYQAFQLKISAIIFLLLKGEKAYSLRQDSCHFHRVNGYFGTVKDGKPHGIGKKSFLGSCFCL